MAIYAEDLESVRRNTGELPIILSVPINPETLIHSILASGEQGKIIPDVLRLVVTVPALTEKTVIYPSRPGYNVLFIAPFIVRPSVKSSSITAEFVIKGESIWRRGPYPMSDDLELDMRMFQNLQYGFASEYIQVTYKNNLSQDIEITITTQDFLVEKSTYDEIILPILRQGYQHLKDYAEFVKRRFGGGLR